MCSENIYNKLLYPTLVPQSAINIYIGKQWIKPRKAIRQTPDAHENSNGLNIGPCGPPQ